MVPNGQAIVQTLQPTQVASSTTLGARQLVDGNRLDRASVHAPGLVALRASVGHLPAGLMATGTASPILRAWRSSAGVFTRTAVRPSSVAQPSKIASAKAIPRRG